MRRPHAHAPPVVDRVNAGSELESGLAEGYAIASGIAAPGGHHHGRGICAWSGAARSKCCAIWSRAEPPRVSAPLASSPNGGAGDGRGNRPQAARRWIANPFQRSRKALRDAPRASRDLAGDRGRRMCCARGPQRVRKNHSAEDRGAIDASLPRKNFLSRRRKSRLARGCEEPGSEWSDITRCSTKN